MMYRNGLRDRQTRNILWCSGTYNTVMISKQGMAEFCCGVCSVCALHVQESQVSVQSKR